MSYYDSIIEQNKRLRAQNPVAYDAGDPVAGGTSPAPPGDTAPQIGPGRSPTDDPNKPPTSQAGPAATAPMGNQNAQQRGVSIQQYVNDWRNTLGGKLKQSDPAGWDKLIKDLKTEGYNNVTLDQRSDGLHKGIMIDGKFVKLADGYDNPIWDESGGGPGGEGGAAAGPPGLTDFQQKTRAMILEQLGKLGQPVTADDPVIKAQMDASKLTSDRSLAEQQKAMAERLYGEGQGGGVGNGQLLQGIQTSRERAGAGLATEQGQLMSSELQNRRAQLSNLLGLATQTGDAESARALQLQIAQMDDAIRRATLAEQARQHDDEVGRALVNDREARRQWEIEHGTDLTGANT